MGIEDGIPEEAPPANKVDDDVPSPSTEQRKKRNLLLTGVVAAVVIFAVLVGVLIGSNNGSDGSKSGSKSSVGGDPTAAPVLPTVPEPTGTEPTVPDPTAAPVEPDIEVEFFESDVGPFKNLQVPLQTSKIQIYSDEDEVRGDLQTMSRFLLNNVAERGIGNPHFADAAFGFPTVEVDAGQEPSLPGEEGGRDEGGNDDDGNDDDRDSYLTNNQEDGVDEADIAKSDGKFIFSILGKYVLVVRADTDELVAQIELPPIDVGDITIPGMGIPEPEPDIFPSSDIMPGRDVYVPQPSGQALLLSETTLAVIAGGYAQGNYYRQDGEPNIITQKGGTLLQLFSLEKLYSTDDFTSVDKEDVLTVVGEKYLNGDYLSGYMIGSVAVVTTTSYVYNEAWLVRPFERWAPQYSGTTNDEYLEAIQQDSDEVINKYIDILLSELELSPGVMPDIVKLGLPTSSLSDTDEYTNAEFGNGYANFMLQIATVDMESPSMLPQDAAAIEDEEAPELDVKALVQFMSHTWAICYATTKNLIVIGQGYNFNMRWQASEDTSMLYQYDIQGVNITPMTTGSVPGTVSSKHWIDSVGDEVRIATTKRQWIPFNVEGGPIIIRAGQMWQGGFDVPEVIPSGGVVSMAGMTARVIDPPGPNDLARLEDCTDLPNQCFDEATGLPLDGTGDCSAVAADCPAGMLFMSINNCQFHCEADFSGSQCLEYVSMGLDNASPCITGSNLMDCLALHSNGCEEIMPFETCPMQFGCIREATNATAAPEVTTNKYIQVFNCQDAATVECPLDAITDAGTCQRVLDGGCEETYMATADCNFFCRDPYHDTMCVDYFDMVVSGAVNCPLSHVRDCAHFLEQGCDITISDLDMCEFDIRCEVPNATAAPEPTSDFIPIFNCEDAVTVECPLDAIADTCQRVLDGGCEETYMATADCNFFCRDWYAGTMCVDYFDMVVSGAMNCPLARVSECAHFLEQGCEISIIDLDMCEFDIQCGGDTPAPDLHLIRDCSMVDESCLDSKFETACSDMMSNCGEVFYSNSTCRVYCLDSMEGGTCGQYAHTALYEGNACIDSIALNECLGWEGMDCMIVGLGLCPESFECIIDGRETLPPMQMGCPSVGQGCMDEASVNECVQLEEDGCEEIMIDRDTCEVTCFSRTENNLFVLKDNSEGQLEITGSVQFGKISEEITSMLFRDKRAFAVTFLRRDPLYIIDLNDPTDPTIVGALDIPGFSSYLYPINSASTLLLGIGQHADPVDGNNLGLKLSIFDVEDPNTMAEIWSYHDGQQWSSAEFDDKAWRYLADGDGKGTLIIPISRSGNTADGMYEWFDGFGVFSVDSEVGIQHLYDIDHVQDPDQCYVCHRFTMRSFVIDGNIITQKGRSFASTGLTSGTPNWLLPLLEVNAGGNNNNCCGWFMEG